MRCTRCWNESVEEADRQRKAQLDAMPRCECCKRRATYRINGVGLCGVHKKKVEAARVQQVKSMAIPVLGLLGTPQLSPEQIVEMARNG